MINPAAFDLNADLAQSAAEPPSSTSRLKMANPNYKEGWYNEFTEYQDTYERPICTPFSILECYQTQRVSKDGSTVNQTLHLKVELAPVNGLIGPSTFAYFKLWGEGLSAGPEASVIREGSSNYREFGQWALATLGPAAFLNPISLTISNKDKTWSEERLHFPALIGAQGLVAFCPVDSFRDRIEYGAYFFTANGQNKPFSPYEFSHGRQYKAPKCDYDTYLEVLQARYNSWAGLTGGEDAGASAYTMQPPQTVPAPPSGFYAAPLPTQDMAPAPAAQTDDDIPF